MGEYALEYTWFKNFPWKYALCSNCHKHLGWHYAYKDYQFYGLIADELIFVTEGDTQ
jgi:hypothetical protein